MTTYLITAPDGRKFKVTGSGTKEDALAQVQKAQAPSGPDFSEANMPGTRHLSDLITGPRDQSRPELQQALDAKALEAANPSWIGPLAQGLTLGFGDEMLGGIGGMITAARGQGFQKGYDALSGAVRRGTEAERQLHPIRSAALEIAGSLPAAAVPVGKVAQGASLLARVGQGAKAGALLGGVYGAGASEGGLGNRAAGAATGAVAGGVTGGAVPVAASAVRAVASPFVDAVAARVNPAGQAMRKVVQRVEGSGRTVDSIANRIARAQAQGQNLSVADAGGRGVQTLARTVANTPGPGADRIAAQTNISAMGQGERLKRMVNVAFNAPEGAYEMAKATVMDARSKAAAPFYKIAYNTPVPYTFDLEKLLQTPAGRAGLAAAKRNTANRREPWAQWFINVADDGSIIDARRVPDTRALDEVKRVLDNMVEATKRPADGSPFGKALNTPESIAIKSVRDDLLNFLKENNRPYAKALQVAGDNIRADLALEFGRNALSTDPRIIARRMGVATAYGRDTVFDEGERELARMGLAEAIRGKIDNAGLTHNALLKFFGNREQIARIRPFFKTPQEFSDFRSAIINEARKRKTLDFVRSNSTTARQLADLQEAGQMGEAINLGVDIAKRGPIDATISALARGVRRLGGLTPEVADNIAKILMTADPGKVRGIVGKIKLLEASRINSAERNARIRAVLTNLLAGQEGRTLAPRQSGPLAVQ